MPKPARPFDTRRAAATANTLNAEMRAQPRIVLRQLLQLDAVIDGEGHQPRHIAPARRRPMDVIQCAVPAQRPLWAPAIEELPKLGPSRVFGRTKKARHRKGAASVRPSRADREALSAQPAAQETGHEGVAGAENVVNLAPGSPCRRSRLPELSGIGPSKTTHPRAPRFRTMVALDFARMARSESSTLSAPAAIMTSSSVPTIKSQSASTALSRVDTASDFT